MTDGGVEKVYPFDSFSAVFRILGWAGFYRLLNKPVSRFKGILHEIYKPLAFLMALIYNLRHIIFFFQNSHDSENLLESLIVGIPQFNMLTKVGSIHYQTSRIERLNEFLKEDPTFRADDAEGQAILRTNKEQIGRLRRIIMIVVTVAPSIWLSSSIIKKYNDPTMTVPSYTPFEVNSWPRFLLSLLFECCPILWIGYGHISLDLIVAVYYAHAHTQVKIIKQQLEVINVEDGSNPLLQYKDEMDENVNKRFVSVVKRYDRLIWFKNEVDSIFNFSLSFQFVSTVIAVCLVVYRMTQETLLSIQFLFLIALFCILLMQVLLICYFGNLLEFESRSVNNSLYNCDWLTLSPSFRRLMLIAMTCWTKPLEPRIGFIIPLSLQTFFSIVKASYTLYTMLSTTVRSEAISKI